GRPLVGESLSRREPGPAVAQSHDPPAIEPYSSTLVGAERGIVLGKRSGLDSIRIKAEELGLDVPEERRRDLLAAVKALATEQRRLVTDDEFRRLAAGERSNLAVLRRSPGGCSVFATARSASRSSSAWASASCSCWR